MKRQSIQITQHGNLMDKVLDVAVFSIWILVFCIIAPKACDAEYDNNQAKVERFLAK